MEAWAHAGLYISKHLSRFMCIINGSGSCAFVLDGRPAGVYECVFICSVPL